MRRLLLIVVLIIYTLIIDAETDDIETSSSELNDILSLSGIQSGRTPEYNSSALKNFLKEQIAYLENKTDILVDGSGKPVQFKLQEVDFNLLYLKPILDRNVVFRLFDKTDGNKNFDFLKVDDEDLLAKSRFDINRPTVIITHGFLTDSVGESVTLVRDAYLEKYNYNVITVDWSSLSIGSYTVARLMVPKVGNYIGKMINFLHEKGMDSKQTILVGHSLGAHVMGFAGQTAMPKVNLIKGLDPAWPLFVNVPADQRISADDADYVEIIHTNAGVFGTPEISGDWDFFPNGGSLQVGCVELLITACSHLRAFKYLAEQIRGEGLNFYSVSCDSYQKFKLGKCSLNDIAIMGDVDIINTPKGKYYLDTKMTAPFALGSKFLYEYPIVNFLKSLGEFVSNLLTSILHALFSW